MPVLESLAPLFDDSSFPKQDLQSRVLEDFKLNHVGVEDEKVQISFNEVDADDILSKVIDPQAASGYLVFQDESQYTSWLNSELYEPSQEEIMEGLKRGNGA